MTDAVDAMIERDVAVNVAAFEFAKQFCWKPVEWGKDDCSMFAAQWAADRLDRLGREFRFFHYDGEDEARALIEEKGGLVNVWDEVAAANGIYRVPDRIRSGDVGVIHTHLHGDVGCIFVKYGAVCLIRSDLGFHSLGIREKHVLGAWRIP